MTKLKIDKKALLIVTICLSLCCIGSGTFAAEDKPPVDLKGLEIGIPIETAQGVLKNQWEMDLEIKTGADGGFSLEKKDSIIVNADNNRMVDQILFHTELVDLIFDSDQLTAQELADKLVERHSNMLKVELTDFTPGGGRLVYSVISASNALIRLYYGDGTKKLMLIAANDSGKEAEQPAEDETVSDGHVIGGVAAGDTNIDSYLKTEGEGQKETIPQDAGPFYELDQITHVQENGLIDKNEQVSLEGRYKQIALNNNIPDRFSISKFGNFNGGQVGAVTVSSSGSSMIRFDMNLPGDSVQMGPRGAELPVASGSIWRFDGLVTNLFGYDFYGEPDDPLRFIVIKGKGLTYLFGKGYVVMESGKKVLLHNSGDNSETRFECATGYEKYMTLNGEQACQPVVEAKEEIVARPEKMRSASPTVSQKYEPPVKVRGLPTVVLGVVTLTTGGVLGANAIAKNNIIEDKCKDDPLCETNNKKEIERRDALALSSNVLLISGGVLTATGFIVYGITKYKNKKGHRRTSGIKMTPTIATDSFGATIAGSF